LRRAVSRNDRGVESPRKAIIRRVLSVVFFIAFAACSVFIFYHNYTQKQMEYAKKDEQLKKLETEIAAVENENKQLRREIGHLNTKEGVEEIAREKLGLIKPQEIAFVVISSPTPSATGVPVSSEVSSAKNEKLKEEIIKESRKEEGWLQKILNKFGKR